MDLYLTYRGEIPSKRKDKEAVWKIRKAFHSQLSRLWGKEPFSVLKDWEDSNFAAGAPHFVKKINDQTFVPFYGRTVGIGVRLNIKLLTAHPHQAAVVSCGDLDNRLKRIIDALRAPTQENEMVDDICPGGRWYCLMDDDDAVTEVNASLSPYLDSQTNRDSFVFVRVNTSALNVTMENIGMLI